MVLENKVKEAFFEKFKIENKDYVVVYKDHGNKFGTGMYVGIHKDFLKDKDFEDYKLMCEN